MRRAMTMSRRDSSPLSEVRETHQRSMSYLKKERDSAASSSTTSRVLRAIPSPESPAVAFLEFLAAAGFTGWLAGRTGTTGIFDTGLPLGATAGAVGLALAYSGVLPGNLGGHVTNLSLGAIGGNIAFWGAGQGGQSRAKAGGTQGAIVSGALPSYPTAPPMMAAPNPFAYVPQARVPPRVSPLSEAEIQAIARRL